MRHNKRIGLFLSTHFPENMESWASQFGKVTYIHPNDSYEDRKNIDLLIIGGETSTPIDSSYIYKKREHIYNSKSIEMDTNIQRLRMTGNLFSYINKVPIVFVDNALELIPIIYEKEKLGLIPRTMSSPMTSFIVGNGKAGLFHKTLPNITRSRYSLITIKEESSVIQGISLYTHKNKNSVGKDTVLRVNPHDLCHGLIDDNLFIVTFNPYDIVNTESSYNFKKNGFRYGDIVTNSVIIDLLSRGGDNGGGVVIDDPEPILQGAI